MIMNILHISDLHFLKKYEVCKEGYKGMLSKMQNPLVPLHAILEKIQQQTIIDLVIISGDLTDGGKVEDYRFLRQWLVDNLKQTDIVVTLGNHDIKENFRVGWHDSSPSSEPYNEILNYSEFAVVSFDNSAYGWNNGVVSQTQWDWLEHNLQKLQNRPIILVTHHHLLSHQSSTKMWPGTSKFLKILAPFDIRYILNGHTHHPYIGKINGIPYYTAPGMSFIGEDQGAGIVTFEEHYGYNLYQFDKAVMTKQSSENLLSGQVLKTVKME